MEGKTPYRGGMDENYIGLFGQKPCKQEQSGNI